MLNRFNRNTFLGLLGLLTIFKAQANNLPADPGLSP